MKAMEAIVTYVAAVETRCWRARWAREGIYFQFSLLLATSSSQPEMMTNEEAWQLWPMQFCSVRKKLRNDRNRRKVAVTASQGGNDAILFGSPPTG